MDKRYVTFTDYESISQLIRYQVETVRQVKVSLF